VIILSGVLVVLAIALLIAGILFGNSGTEVLGHDGLTLIHVSIGISIVSALCLALGVFLRRGELFGASGSSQAGTSKAAKNARRTAGNDAAVPGAGPDWPGTEDTATIPAPRADVPADAVTYVVRGRKRYHLDSCRQLMGRDKEELTYAEAREEGFSPCTACMPDTALAARAAVAAERSRDTVERAGAVTRRGRVADSPGRQGEAPAAAAPMGTADTGLDKRDGDHSVSGTGAFASHQTYPDLPAATDPWSDPEAAPSAGRPSGDDWSAGPGWDRSGSRWTPAAGRSGQDDVADAAAPADAAATTGHAAAHHDRGALADKAAETVADGDEDKTQDQPIRPAERAATAEFEAVDPAGEHWSDLDPDRGTGIGARWDEAGEADKDDEGTVAEAHIGTAGREPEGPADARTGTTADAEMTADLDEDAGAHVGTAADADTAIAGPAEAETAGDDGPAAGTAGDRTGPRTDVDEADQDESHDAWPETSADEPSADDAGSEDTAEDPGGEAEWLPEADGDDGPQVRILSGTKRYHRGDCALIEDIGDDDEDLETLPRAEAMARGCTPCLVCRPDEKQDRH
jgi:hypothetical protein